jgi:hypothetical protein
MAYFSQMIVLTHPVPDGQWKYMISGEALLLLIDQQIKLLLVVFEFFLLARGVRFERTS